MVVSAVSERSSESRVWFSCSMTMMSAWTLPFLFRTNARVDWPGFRLLTSFVIRRCRKSCRSGPVSVIRPLEGRSRMPTPFLMVAYSAW